MYTGELMIYIGIGLVAVAVIFWIITTIIFLKKKETVVHKIYQND